jgi:hypothetical protein
MGKREQTRKQVNRLQLRREVIRVLTGDRLAQVHGGIAIDADCGLSLTEGCRPSIRPTAP